MNGDRDGAKSRRGSRRGSRRERCAGSFTLFRAQCEVDHACGEGAQPRGPRISLRSRSVRIFGQQLPYLSGWSSGPGAPGFRFAQYSIEKERGRGDGREGETCPPIIRGGGAGNCVKRAEKPTIRKTRRIVDGKRWIKSDKMTGRRKGHPPNPTRPRGRTKGSPEATGIYTAAAAPTRSTDVRYSVSGSTWLTAGKAKV